MTPKLNLKSLEKDQSAFLDLLRGMAAVFVMIHHLKNTFFASYSSLNEKYTSNFFVSAFYFLTGFGKIPVLLFFVLSGFFISRSIFKMLKDKRWSKEKYLIERITRLDLVLVPALLLTAFWDNLSRLVASGSNPIITNGGDYGIAAFIENTLFLQTIFCDAFGSNYPLWSLSFEFWYYMIFPLLFFIVISSSRNKMRTLEIITLSIILLTLSLKNPGIIKYFSIWLLGVVPILLSAPKKSRFSIFILSQYKLISLLLVGVVLVAFRKDTSDNFFNEFVIGSIFSLIIYLTINSPSNSQRPNLKCFLNSFSVRLAAFSYTLYLVHTPIIDFFINVSAASGFGVKWEPTLIHLSSYIILLILIIAYAIAIARFTEFNTHKVRDFLFSKLLQQGG